MRHRRPLDANLLEPGLLSIFRLFITVRWMALVSGLVFSALLDASYLEAFAQFPFASPLMMLVVESSFMLFYVWYRPVQRKLGRFFLPLGLAIVILSPIIGSYVEMLHSSAPRLSAYHANWNLFVTLFIPLVILAWQYSFRAVVKFVIFTTVADILLKVSVIGFDLQDYYVIWSVTAIRIIAFLMVGYMITTLIDAQRRMRRELAEANVNLANLSLTSEQLTISRERNRMARELHDTLAHTLSGVAVQLEAVSALWESDNQSARLMLEQSLAATRSGLTETRRALQSLRASPLEDMGAILAIRNMARAVAKRSGLTLDLQLCDQLENLPPEVEQCLYRVAQEAMANIDQHANARRATVHLTQSNGAIELSISDDGRGFDCEGIDADRQFGLRGMRERAEAVGGTFTAKSQPGRGTEIRLTVPVESPLTAASKAFTE